MLDSISKYISVRGSNRLISLVLLKSYRKIFQVPLIIPHISYDRLWQVAQLVIKAPIIFQNVQLKLWNMAEVQETNW